MIKLSETSWISQAAIPVDEEEYQELISLCPTTRNKIKLFGEVHDVPRFEAVFGTEDYMYSGIKMIANPEVPALVQKCIDYAKENYAPESQWNVALVNWYRDGTQSIGKHGDKETTLRPGAPILSFSFGASRTFRVKANKEVKDKVLIQKKDFETEHGLILVMGGDMQKEFTHEVPKDPKCKEMRINITVRSFLTQEEQEERKKEKKRASKKMKMS